MLSSVLGGYPALNLYPLREVQYNNIHLLVNNSVKWCVAKVKVSLLGFFANNGVQEIDITNHPGLPLNFVTKNLSVFIKNQDVNEFISNIHRIKS